MACPFDTRIGNWKREKGEVKRVLVIPIVIGALGLMTKNLKSNIEIINFKNGIEPLQKACLLGTARILRKVLDCWAKFGDICTFVMQVVILSDSKITIWKAKNPC